MFLLYSPANPSSQFHENLTLSGGVDLILDAGSQQTPKLNQLPLVTSDVHGTLQGRLSDEYLRIHRRDFRDLLQSKDMADFLNLQGKLEPRP